MNTLYGAHRITKVRQVAIPAEIMAAVGLEPGDMVAFRVSPDDPNVVEMIPADVVARRYETGRRLEATERDVEPQHLDDLST